MSWLRTDDGFSSHPKFAGWRPSQKWAFLELMHYCARYRTEGVIPHDLGLLPRAVDARLLTLAEQSGWIDRDAQNRMVIHDWAVYNPKDATAASRAKAYRDRNAHRDDMRDANKSSRAGARRTRPQQQEPKSSSSPSTSTEDQHAPNLNGGEPENLAAAQAALEAPRVLQIEEACLDWAADPRQVEPLAQALTSGEFADVTATVRKRVETGSVQNPAGLLMQLLRLAVKQRERQLVGAVTIATPAEEVVRDAADYARGGHPLEVAVELIERKLKRLGVPEDDWQALTAVAMQAYAETANEEPDLDEPAGSVP